MANEIRIRIGASVDASVANSFTQIEKAAAHAATVIKKEMAGASAAMGKGFARAGAGGPGGTGGGGNPYRRLGADAVASAAQVRTSAAEMARAWGAMAASSTSRFGSMRQTMRAMGADAAVVAREATRAFQQIQREQARASLGLPPPGGGGAGGQRRSRYWFAAGGNLAIRKPTLQTLDMDPVSAVGGFGMGALSFAKRAAIGLAAAHGVETDFGAMIGRNAKEEDLAQDISNAGYFPGAGGPAGQLVGRDDILSETRQTAIATGTSRGDVLEGLRDFVGKTGDLQLGRDLMADMAKLSKATGANMADMVNAAAEVSNSLGDVEGKGDLVKQVMMQIAGQGKLGAVEVRDLASQMAKLASQAGKFEGGAAANVPILGMLAQEAKLRGGAANATQATTSVARFVDTLTKGKEIRGLRNVRWTTKGAGGKAIQHSGIDLFTDKSETTLRDPREIIKQMLSYSGGNLEKLNALMPGTIGNKPLQGIAQIYNQTKGTDADKLAAVNAEFDRMQAAMLTSEEVNRAFAEKMTDSQSKVTVFNEKMADIAEKLDGSFLPALEALGPVFLDLGKDVASAADRFGRWFTGMPQTFGEVAKGINTEEARITRSNALADEAGAALAVPTGKGEFKIAKDEATGLYVATHGAIDKGHVEQAEKDAKARADEIAEKEKALAKFTENASETKIMDPLGVTHVVGHHALSVADSQEVTNRQREIDALKEHQQRQLEVLQRIFELLASGQITFKSAAPPGAPPMGGPGGAGPGAPPVPPDAGH